MDFFGGINQAFKAIQNGYNAADGAMGGMLPGGVKPNVPALAGEVARDLLPGRRVHGATLAKRGASASSHVANNDGASAITSIHGAKQGGKLRETVVENVRDEVVEKGLKTLAAKIPQRVVTGATGVGTGVAIADTVNDVTDIYSGVLEATTGKDLPSHVRSYRDQSPNSDPASKLFPGHYQDGPYIGNGHPQQITQGKEQTLYDEINSRVRHAGEVFNPLEGEWGLSELLYGR